MCRLAAKLPPHIIAEDQRDALRLEFTAYQLDDDRTLPTYVHGETRLDAFWGDMSERRDGSGTARFALLAKVMLAFLVVPLSNASSERAFSMVRKIETDFRSELAQGTTCTLLSVKMNTDVRPSVFASSAKVLESARNAVSSYNQEHRNIVKK